MRALLVLLLLAFGLPARADQPANLPQADRDAIGAVIGQQIEAFRRDDGPAAFGYASPAIQGQFGDPAHFMDMVRQGFPPVYRPRSVRMGELVERDGRLGTARRTCRPRWARRTGALHHGTRTRRHLADRRLPAHHAGTP